MLISDTLVDRADGAALRRLVTTAVDLPRVDAVGLLLGDAQGRLQVGASTSEQEAEAGRWPMFVPAALERGFRTVHAVPLRARETTVGALSLFRGGQLQTALSSRIVIEQAKGVLAERPGLSMGRAFLLLRQHARKRGLRLSALAQQVVSGG